MNKSSFLIIPIITLGVVSFANADPLVEESAIPGEFSANISLTSDYTFRGISQTGNNPAVQGGFDYSYDFGPAAVSAGIWASNVKFADATIEIDYYAGVGGSVDMFSWDLSAIYYTYPGADSSLNYDFFEIAPSIGYDFGFMAVNAGLNYSPEYFGDSGDAYYTHGGIDIPLGKYFTLSGTVGYQSIDDNAAWGTDDYTDYGVSVSTEIAGFGLSVGWTDTDLPSSQCDDACGIVAVALSRSF
ncbi:TorF family putative porin [Sneathiella sp.]|uniref:TorF family putative porin n=1 Tax=Sneathiella sp. TaxID=1964365 RepID=UPI00262903F8|nr:TorF family putative porin [Sneathiella sp.]MDF2367225.1 TorF family putative porin [Sneathiella sp.]